MSHADAAAAAPPVAPRTVDRKSTRLNSSHLVISYAVFCLKKKKNEYERDATSYKCALARRSAPSEPRAHASPFRGVSAVSLGLLLVHHSLVGVVRQHIAGY